MSPYTPDLASTSHDAASLKPRLFCVRVRSLPGTCPGVLVGMKQNRSARIALAALSSLTLVVSMAATAQAADPAPSPSPSGQEVPQPSACAQYTQHVPSFVYAGQSATMSVTVRGIQDNANLTATGSSADGSQVVFNPASATATASTNSDATTQVAFTFTPSDTSTVGINWTDHCSAEAVGHQDRSGSTAPSTVRVVHSAPPSGPPCGAPDMYSVQPDRSHVLAGDSVHLTVSIRTRPCYGMESGPHDFTVVGRKPGQTSSYPYEVVGQGQTDEYGQAQVTAWPTRDTVYGFAYSASAQGPLGLVTVDRTAGTCAGKVTNTAPAAVAVGTTTRVSGRAPAGYDITLFLRRHGQTAFTPHAVTANSAGTWTTTLRADDDYRYYASTSACDSPPGLLIVRPTITGPATARKGSPVTLTAHAPAGKAVGVYFRPAGGTFVLRRTGQATSSGIFLVTYRPDRDYRYYAVTTADGRTTTPGLTQVG